MSLVRFSNQLPSLFDHFFENDLYDWSNRHFSTTDTTLPSVNIKESTDEFEVELAAPGFVKTDFSIELNHDLLTISSEKKVENETKEGQQFAQERIQLPVIQPYHSHFQIRWIMTRSRLNMTMGSSG